MSRAEFYRLVSAAIKRLYPATQIERVGIEMVARELAHTFAQHNSEFDSDRFLRDCGLL